MLFSEITQAGELTIQIPSFMPPTVALDYVGEQVRKAVGAKLLKRKVILLEMANGVVKYSITKIEDLAKH